MYILSHFISSLSLVSNLVHRLAGDDADAVFDEERIRVVPGHDCSVDAGVTVGTSRMVLADRANCLEFKNSDVDNHRFSRYVNLLHCSQALGENSRCYRVDNFFASSTIV